MYKHKQRKKPVLLRVAKLLPDGRASYKTVRADQIIPAPKWRERLSDEQRRRADRLWDRIGPLVRPDLGKAGWVDGFCFDLNVDQELGRWEVMADVFNQLRANQAMAHLPNRGLLAAIVGVAENVVDLPAVCPGVTDAIVQFIKAEFQRFELAPAILK